MDTEWGREGDTDLKLEELGHLRQEVFEEAAEKSLFAAHVTGAHARRKTLPVLESGTDERPLVGTLLLETRVELRHHSTAEDKREDRNDNFQV